MPPLPDSLPDTLRDALMRDALRLAGQSVGVSDPNPRVGCVIAAPGGRLLGRGHTQRAGGAHAEIMALRDAAARGEDLRGATVLVTLEPCVHHGRTPPCCDALIAAGVTRVVIAVTDPNPLVDGRGVTMLRAAGVDVTVLADGPLAEQARELNIGFFSRMQRGRPWVRLKAALSLDGRTALNNGVSQWITGEVARADGHAWRKRAGAVLTGAGTVRKDNPRLDVRLADTLLQPIRVVIDSRLDTPAEARLLEPPGQVLIYTAQVEATRREGLQARGAEIVSLPADDGRVDLAGVLADLARRGINELHVEAGQQLNGAFVQQRLVDEFLVYLAPVLLGAGRDMTSLGPLERLSDGVPLRFVGVDTVGADLRIVARPVAGA